MYLHFGKDDFRFLRRIFCFQILIIDCKSLIETHERMKRLMDMIIEISSHVDNLAIKMPAMKSTLLFNSDFTILMNFLSKRGRADPKSAAMPLSRAFH